MAERTDLAVSVGADINPLVVGLKKASGETNKFRGTVNSGGKALAKYSAVAATAGMAIATHIVKQSLAAIDAQAKMAQQLNTTSASMATLTRAGELSGVSLQQISAASRNLTVRLGEAKEGSNSAADALSRLKLDADELAALPLDDRIQAINVALKENIPATERAAVAADLFGAKAGAAIQQLNPETIAQARRETELFGTALSDVDAAKVEMANDAMSTIGVAMDGIAQQAAIQLAPILKALADLFMDAAEDAGGLGNTVEDSFRMIINGTGFVIDSIEGVSRAFDITANAIIAGAQPIIVTLAEIAKGWIMIADAVPGIDMSGNLEEIERFQRESVMIFNAATSEIGAILEKPLPSVAFDKWVDDAKKAGEAAAQAVVEAREQSGIDLPQVESAEDISENEAFQKRIDALKNRYVTEQQLTLDHQQTMADLQRGFEEGQFSSDEEFKSVQLQAEKDYMAKLQAIKGDGYKGIEGILASHNQAVAASTLSAGRSILNTMSNTSKSAFEANKKFALADALISTYQGIAAGVKLGYPAAIPAVAFAAAQGFAQVSAIRSQTFGGGGSGGGGSSSASSAASSVASSTPQTDQSASSGTNISVSGINPDQLFSGQQIVDIINLAQDQGAVLRTT